MHIRLATAPDASAVRAIYAPIVESTPTSFELVVPSEGEMASRIAECQPAYPWLVADGDEGTQGYAYAAAFASRPAYAWSVTTSVYIAETARGRGIGRALYTSLFALLTAQGYRQAMAGITLPNPASVALHERAGFARVGTYEAAGWKFGAWHDVGWWQRPLAEGAAPPVTPTPVDELPLDVLEASLAAGADLLA